jgi:glutamate synthase (NADPH/NADH) small chain
VDADNEIREVVIETKQPLETKEGEEPRFEITRRTEKADRVIMAVGAMPRTKIVRTTSGLENDEKNFLITRDVPYGMTTRKGVFAGGDVANRQATVVHAMQDAKKVAEGIAKYVDAVKLMEAINI